MKRLRAWTMRLAGLFRTGRQEQELAAEMESHLQLHIEDNLRSGMTPEQARRDAILKLGGVEQTKQATRERGTIPFLENLLRDMRYAVRHLRKSPGFTVTVILTLALGIGANTAIFSLAYAILLRSLPVPNPNNLVRYVFRNGNMDIGLSGPAYDELRRHETVADLMAWGITEFTRTSGSKVRNLDGALMSGNGFAVLQLEPYLGRSFSERDDVPGGGPDGYKALLGYGYWKDSFQSNPAIIGKPLTLNGRKVTIIGVLPPKFHGLVRGQSADLVLPLAFDEALHPKHPWRHAPGYMWLTVMGRLRDGQSLQSAKSNLAAIQAQVREAADPSHQFLDGFFAPFKFGVVNGRMGRSDLAETYRQPLLMLELLAGLLLILCCANIALLLQARSSGRIHEFAVRSALGAGRSRLFAHVLLETLLLGCAGTASGFALGWLLAHSIAALFSDASSPVHIDVAPNFAVFGFAATAAFLTAIIAGLLPAIRASRTEPVLDLKQAQNTTRKIGGAWIVSTQIAVGIVLTTSAIFLGSTFLHLFLEHSGFQPGGVLFADYNLNAAKLSQTQQAQAKKHILERLEHVQGIQAAAWMSVAPLIGAYASSSYVARDGHGVTHTDMQIWPEDVTPDYFAAIGTRVVEGRAFTPQDKNTEAVCVLSVSAAARFFPGEDAVGKTVYTSESDSPQDVAKAFNPKNGCRVIGMAEDAHFASLKNASPRLIYRLIQKQDPFLANTLVIRAVSPALAATTVRSISREVVPDSAPPEISLFPDVVAASLKRERLLIRLSGGFSGIALLLTGVGLFGILARRVTERTREIGVRMTFGAPRSAILRMILFSTALQVGAGIAIGLTLAIAMARAMRGLLYGISVGDYWAYAVSVAVILACCAAAAILPARRAASIDPMQALRSE